MKRNRRLLIVSMATAAAVSMAVTGCSKYEKIELAAGRLVQTAEASGEEQQAPGDAGAASETEATAGVSANEVETTRETMPVFEDRDETIYVNAIDLNVRTAPSPSAEVVTRLNTGAELHRTGYSDSWSRVAYDGRECYVSSQYLSARKPEVPETTAVSESAQASAGEVRLHASWKYADYSKINSGKAVLYRAEGENRKGKVVCVNAGHGTKGGSSVKTQCHPDGSPKVTGGTTGAGATTAVAVSGGMQFADGTPEAKVTLAMAKVLKE